jgi:hypothetical protein
MMVMLSRKADMYIYVNGQKRPKKTMKGWHFYIQ